MSQAAKMATWMVLVLLMAIQYSPASVSLEDLKEKMGEIINETKQKIEDEVHMVKESQAVQHAIEMEHKVMDEFKKVEQSPAVQQLEAKVTKEEQKAAEAIKDSRVGHMAQNAKEEYNKDLQPILKPVAEATVNIAQSNEFNNMLTDTKELAKKGAEKVKNGAKEVSEKVLVKAINPDAKLNIENPLNCNATGAKKCPASHLAVNRAQYDMQTMDGTCECTEKFTMRAKIKPQDASDSVNVLLCPVKLYKVNKSQSEKIHLSSSYIDPVDEEYQVVEGAKGNMCPEEEQLVKKGWKLEEVIFDDDENGDDDYDYDTLESNNNAALKIPHWTYIVIGVQSLFIIFLGVVMVRKSGSSTRNAPRRASQRNTVHNMKESMITV